METYIFDAVNYNLIELRDIESAAMQIEELYGSVPFIDYINEKIICDQIIVSFFTDTFYQLIDYLY